MAEKNMSIQEAIDDIGQRYARLSKAFLENYKNLPDFPHLSVKKTLDEYVLGLGTWVTTNDEWSFITPRYFGENRDEVRKTRKVTLMPRRVEKA